MKQISKDQFFAEYEKPSNFDELINADILVMPAYRRQRNVFSQDQCIFKELRSEYDGTLLFYDDDQNPPVLLSESLTPADSLYYLGVIVTTIQGLITIYPFLKDKLPNEKISLTHAVKINENSIEVGDKFEGTIEEYKIVMNERLRVLETLNKK